MWYFMLMSKVSGIELGGISETVRPALQAYSELADGAVAFDLDSAAQLRLTPEKPNTARSESQVHHLGEVAGTLYVIVFDMEDGTGDENTFKLEDSMLGWYPLRSEFVPRSKAGIHSEAHLALASFEPHSDEAPIMFANHLDVVSFNAGRMRQLAHLGQDLYDYARAERGQTIVEPTATLTTGYSAATGERFGDPHAVCNRRLSVQVAAFLAITDELADQHSSALQLLGAQEPELRF